MITNNINKIKTILYKPTLGNRITPSIKSNKGYYIQYRTLFTLSNTIFQSKTMVCKPMLLNIFTRSMKKGTDIGKKALKTLAHTKPPATPPTPVTPTLPAEANQTPPADANQTQANPEQEKTNMEKAVREKAAQEKANMEKANTKLRVIGRNDNQTSLRNKVSHLSSGSYTPRSVIKQALDPNNPNNTRAVVPVNNNNNNNAHALVPYNPDPNAQALVIYNANNNASSTASPVASTSSSSQPQALVINTANNNNNTDTLEMTYPMIDYDNTQMGAFIIVQDNPTPVIVLTSITSTPTSTTTSTTSTSTKIDAYEPPVTFDNKPSLSAKKPIITSEDLIKQKENLKHCGIPPNTKITETISDKTITDTDLLSELKLRGMLKDDDAKTEVSVKAESGKEIIVGQSKYPVKVTRLGQAYLKQMEKVTLYPNTPDQANIEYKIAVADVDSNKVFLSSGEHKHLVVAYNKNDDEYHVIGYLTSKTSGDLISNKQFKQYQNEKMCEVNNNDKENQKPHKLQYFRPFENAKSISKDEVTFIKWGSEYMKQIDIAKIEDHRKELSAKPLCTFNKDGYTKRQAIEACLAYDKNVNEKKPHPKTKDQIKLDEDNQAKQKEKVEAKKKEKENLKLKQENNNTTKENINTEGKP